MEGKSLGDLQSNSSKVFSSRVKYLEMDCFFGKQQQNFLKKALIPIVIFLITVICLGFLICLPKRNFLVCVISYLVKKSFF